MMTPTLLQNVIFFTVEDHWLGLSTLHSLTTSNVDLGSNDNGRGRHFSLVIEIWDESLHKHVFEYPHFSLGSESEGYPLHIADAANDASTVAAAAAALLYSNGAKFSTGDRDQDQSPLKSCAQDYQVNLEIYVHL